MVPKSLFAAICLVALVSAFPAAAFAQAQQPAQEQALDAACAKTGSNAEYKDCLRGLYAEIDKELNRVWNLVMNKIASADYPESDKRRVWRRELTQAQRAWITFRDNDCEAVLYEYWGGSGAGGFFTLCKIKHTRDRIDHLRARYDLKSG